MKYLHSLLVISILAAISAKAQTSDTIIVKSRIVDESYEAVAFVNIYSKMLGKGTISRKDGKFAIKVTDNDTLEFSAVSYEKFRIPAKQLSGKDTVLIMSKKVYELGEVDVMALRWHNFKHQMLNTNVKKENQKVIQLQGLPNINQERVELGPYAGMTNPVSILLIYFGKKERTKRRQARWQKTYLKYNPPKDSLHLQLQLIKSPKK